MDVITHPAIEANTTGTDAIGISGRPMVFQFDGTFSGTLKVQMSLTGAAGEWHDVYFTGTDGSLTNAITAAGLYIVSYSAKYMRFVLSGATDPNIVPKTADILALGGY